VCGDTPASIVSAVEAVRTRSSSPMVLALTKADVAADAQLSGADIAVSAHTGRGLTQLLGLVEERITEAHGEPALDQPALTHARHRAAVGRAAEELRAFVEAWRHDVLPASVAAAHVRAAAESLAELIGVVRTDDVLDVVFRRFCVGK